MLDKTDFELLQRRLEAELTLNQTKRDNLENGILLLKKELGRINDRTDELTRELIFVIDQLRKF